MRLFLFSAMITTTYAFGGISAAISFIVLPIPAIRQYLCSKLDKNQLYALIWRCCKYTNKCFILHVTNQNVYLSCSLTGVPLKLNIKPFRC